MKQFSIATIKSDLKCRVVGPEDSDYDKLRTVFYGGIDKKPAAIILVENSDDVSKAVLLAKENGMELAIRSGGHSVAGDSVSDGGIVIDLRTMKGMEINETEKTAWAESGLTAGELVTEIDKYDLALGFGDTGTVGIGGITLGGGIGYLVRKHGLTIDSLLEAEIVTANGKILIINNESHPDLFWAIRGGGGNFGIVTKFKYKLHDIGQVLGGMMILPATPEVISGFISEANKAPDELSSILNIMPAFPMPGVPEELVGKVIAMAIMIYSGDIDKGEKVIAPFRTLDKPIVDMVKPMRYPEIYPPEGEEYHPKAVSKTMFINEVNLDTAKKILENLSDLEAPMKVAQLRVLGGAMAKVGINDTAFAHRRSKILANIAAFYDTEQEMKARTEWAEQFSKQLFQGDKGTYVGFLDTHDQEAVHSAYPDETWKRLIEVKKKYDPTNLFSLNQNIKY